MRPRIQDFEVLRGVAILMVLVGNVPYNLFAWRSSLGAVQNAYWNGSAGIDLFFAVTGYTTATALLPHGAGRVSGGPLPSIEFFVRRFWRRTPLAWIWLGIPLSISLLLGRSAAFHAPAANVASGIAALLEVHNIWLTHVFDTGEGGVLFSYWTLSLGTQLALLLPVLAAAFGRRLPWVLAGLVAYTFVMPQEAFCYYTRPGPFALGALLAIASGHPEYRMGTPGFLGRGGLRGAVLATAMLVLGALQSDLLRPLVSIPFGLAALVAGALVYAASFEAGYVVGTGAARRVWASLGRRSYAIYLSHVPAFALTRELYAHFRPSFGDPATRQVEHMVIVALLLTAMASEASYRLVQCPGERRAETRRALASAA